MLCNPKLIFTFAERGPSTQVQHHFGISIAVCLTTSACSQAQLAMHLHHYPFRLSRQYVKSRGEHESTKTSTTIVTMLLTTDIYHLSASWAAERVSKLDLASALQLRSRHCCLQRAGPTPSADAMESACRCMAAQLQMLMICKTTSLTMMTSSVLLLRHRPCCQSLRHCSGPCVFGKCH